MQCCSGGDDATSASSAASAITALPQAHSWRRRIVRFVQWVLPIAALALVPKCPGCVAAYVLLFTGVGLSLPVATAVRWTLIVVCVVALGYLVVRMAMGIVRRVRC